jgi:rubredoxin
MEKNVWECIKLTMHACESNLIFSSHSQKGSNACSMFDDTGVSPMTKWRCIVCGYIYNPKEGDPQAGIKPETPFEELPDDWVCPVCGASKDQFEKV